MSFQCLTIKTFHIWERRLAALALALLLSGCGITAALQGAGQQIGPTVMAIDSDIYAIAVAKYQAAQMFKAQIDGTIQLPPLPPPTPIPPSPFPSPSPGPVVVNPMPPGPIQPPTPVPVPSLRQRHAALDRQNVDQAVYDHIPAKEPRPSGVADTMGQPGTFPFDCPSCKICVSSCKTPQPARTPPSDLRSLFGPDGHLKQTTGL